MAPPDGFYQILAQAVTQIGENGYSSQAELDRWLAQLREAARRFLGSDASVDAAMRDALGAVYAKMIDRGRIIELVPELRRFGLEIVKPRLRAELDRRILASADLIKLNRKAAIDKTLQRFTGWSTSIPPGGGGLLDKQTVKADIAKSVKDASFEARRVAIDQGHKLIANISELVASDNGAIAGVWDSHWRQANYDYRERHKKMDGKIYLVRDSWAAKQGLIKKDGHQYIDEIERPAELPFCRCAYRWIVSPRRLPAEMLTEKGRDWIARGQMPNAA